MRLPVWLLDGNRVLYVFEDGHERKMEVYNMEGHLSYFAGTELCALAIHTMTKLESPWKEIMERRRRFALQNHLYSF